MSIVVVSPDYAGPREAFRHTWEGLLNIDQFRWMVRRDVQDQLKMARDEIGGRVVRAVGMLDDEMRVLGKDPMGFRDPSRQAPRLNWQIVDYVIQSLLELGMNPMFTTTFMPGHLASGTETCFSTRANISPPKSWKEWGALVQASVRHAIDRFGRDVVRQWYFEVWNEPNLAGFWAGGEKGYHELWLTTYRAIKEVDAELRVGGPSAACGQWVGELLEFTQKHDCVPDYLISHVYNNDSENNPLSPFDGPQEDKVSKSPHFAAGVMRGVHAIIQQMNFKGEVHWNEWGRSWFGHDPVRETPNEAAFAVKTMSEVSQLADYFAYWCLSDVYDQVGYGAETFHGNYGMLNLQGLRKPHYHAFQLLARLGTQRVKVRGQGLTPLTNAIATSDGRKHYVMVYSFDAGLQASQETLDVTIHLPGKVHPESLTLYVIDESNNNILQHWREMGSPAYLSAEQLAFLRSHNLLRASPAPGVSDHEGVPCAHFRMQHPGVALLEVA